MSKLLSLLTSGTLKEAGSAITNVLDSVITNDEERLEAKKQLLDVTSKLATDLTATQSDVLKTEITGTKLQRNWRPVVMLMFAGIVVYEYFVAPVFGLPKSNLPTQFWSLLEIGLGGYVIGRSVEKITNSVSDNWSNIPNRKKQ
jgi:hypothetical protein